MSDLTVRDALESMVRQFAYWSDSAGGYWTGGLSALEEAFEVLGWSDPQPAPEVRCDEPGCMKQSSCGWRAPFPVRYRRTCGDHMDEHHRPMSAAENAQWDIDNATAQRAARNE